MSVVAEQAEEGEKEGCGSAFSCEKGWTKEGCQPVIWKEAKKFRHWYVDDFTERNYYFWGPIYKISYDSLTIILR